jgi:Zn-dependent protease with chaperone function
VTATLECSLIGVAIGLVASLPYGLAVSQFGRRMSSTLIGMLMLVALLVLWVLRSREFEADERAGT